jgi:hypothetical protein
MQVPSKPAAAKSLLNSMLEHESLPALVEKLSPPALERMVSDLGIEDSGALVMHASQTQLMHLLDSTIWTGAKPGDPETLSVETLLRWLAVWIDGDMAADKLFELGEDFCALAFSRLVVVSDIDLSARIDDEFTQVLGEFLLRGRVDDEWDLVHAALVALWDDYPDFAESVFGRLAFRHSILGMYGEDDTAGVLNADASHEHERKRESEGFVTSVMAGTFLRQISRADLDALAAEDTYDLQSADYFRRRDQEARAAQEARDAQAARRRRSQSDELDEEEELDALEAELEAFEQQQHAQPALLTGPQRDSKQQPIRTALGAMEDQVALDARMDEMVYLANLLIAGSERDGERILEAQAAEIAMATCNLGGSYLLWIEFGDDSSASAFSELLAEEPGMVRLFRIGWHLLSRVPIQVVTRLQRLIADPDIRQALAARPMVLAEVEALLADDDLLTQVSAQQFTDARDTVRLLTILLEPQAVQGLSALIDATPRLSNALEIPAGRWHEVHQSSRNIDSMADLMQIDGFLKSLSDQIRSGH